MTEPVATAPVVLTPKRNRVGVAALIVAVVAIAVPILFFIVFVIGSLLSGAQGDGVGYAILSAYFLSIASIAIVSPIAIVAIVLGIVAVARKGFRKLQGVLAIILSAVPAAAVFFLPAAIDTLF